MKHIKQFEYFKPIKINSEKPFKIKKNIDKSIKHLQRGIKVNRKKLDDPKESDVNKHAKINNDKNAKIQKLKDLQFKKLKQQEYLRNNPVHESVDIDENGDTLLSILSSENFKPEDILNCIGDLDDGTDYKIPEDYEWQSHSYVPKYDINGISMLFKSKKLEELMDADNGIISHFLSFGAYGNSYEYYVDNSELDYLESYLSEISINKIKDLSETFNFKMKISSYNGRFEEGEIVKLFEYLCLNRSLDDFKNEIAMENEEAIKQTAKKLLKSVPFDIDSNYNKGFDTELYFEYNEMIEYMKKHKMEVKSIKEFLENIYEASDFCYEFEEGKDEFLPAEFKDLDREVQNICEKYIDYPEDIFWKLIENDKLDVIKKHIELAEFSFKYDTYMDYNKERLNLFEVAKKIDGNVLAWFASKEFENIIKDRSEEELGAYREFIFGEDVKKYGM